MVHISTLPHISETLINKMGNCDRYIKIIQDYLTSKSITAKGLLKEDLDDKNDKSLIYVSYAIEKFNSNSKLEQKVKLLSSERGNKDNKNDIKRNYCNQLVEFHALYTLTELMEFNFIDFDVPSKKKQAESDKDCDFLIEKNNNYYFAEAKDLSGEIMNTYIFEGYEHYTPAMKETLEKWIKRKIKEVKEKCPDFLILHVPTWGLFDNNIENISKFHQGISKDIISKDRKFFWSIPNTAVNRLIFITAFGSWEIELIN